MFVTYNYADDNILLNTDHPFDSWYSLRVPAK